MKEERIGIVSHYFSKIGVASVDLEFEEIIDIGKRRGKLTYDEINDAVPSEYFSPG